MLKEILRQSWQALMRSPSRSLLTMLGIVWGIVAVALLVAYGSSFRSVLVAAFDAFGQSVVICWPGQTSEQAGGERAGRPVRFEQADVAAILNEVPLVKYACLETVQWKSITYQDRLTNNPVRGVCPEYGEMRNEVPSNGRWITAEDMIERRRVVFLGNAVKKKLFSGRQAIGETVTIAGMRFTVIGEMDKKIQMSNYFNSDDESVWIPYSAAGDLWNNRYGSVLVFETAYPKLEQAAIRQARAAIAKRQNFSPTDERAFQAFGREQFRPVIDGITIGLQTLLLFIGILTLGIGGVGVMNIMLVSVDERIREIGLRRALGAKKWHIRAQFLSEALVITLAGGAAGVALAHLLSMAIGTLPLLGPLYEDTSGRADIHLVISPETLAVTIAVLVLVGTLSGLAPALRASRLDPAQALRYE
ncbi:MAG: ABC transporter permease [Bryobacteraceae bacterium]|nr:ABC transporter permease [Bryobacteraceae bacterium]